MQNKKSTTALQSIVAGTAAGGLEALVTYPTEYVKTRLQLLRRTNITMPTSPFRILVSTIRENGVRSLYTGGTAFCVSNGAKSGVRFFSFDLIKSLFPLTREGKVPIHATLCAGLVAGMAESFAVLTPGETIKTRMIDDRAGPRVYKSTGHAVRTILAAEGLAGLYRGVWPVAMKQSANAMVRFTTFGTLKDHLGPQLSNMNLPASTICGSLAGAVTVYCTMPFDNVKTQLQSIQGRSSYSGSLDCARKLVARDGLARLWKGTSPRLVRLSVSGAISFSVYEQVVQWMSDPRWKQHGKKDATVERIVV